MVQLHDLVSRLMAAAAAAQGLYSRQNSMKQYAFSGPKPMDPRMPCSAVIPSGELRPPIPNRTEQLDTTISFAVNPQIKATAICQKPSPAGARIGTSAWPIAAPKLSDTRLTMP